MKNLVTLFITLHFTSCAQKPDWKFQDGAIQRESLVSVGNGALSKRPNILLDKHGNILVTLVNFNPENEKESLSVYIKKKETNELNLIHQIENHHRAWSPSIKQSPTGDIWLAWYGAKTIQKSPHARTLWLKKIYPISDKEQALTAEQDTILNPNFEIDSDGNFHFVFEKFAKTNLIIQYLKTNPTLKIIESKQISQEGFNRRPSLALWNNYPVISWDHWSDTVQTNAADPDYDILLRRFDGKRWSSIIKIDNAAGIQSAPSLSIHRGQVYIAYHSTLNQKLLKEWKVRRIDQKNTIQEMAVHRQSLKDLSHETNMGSEFPFLVWIKNKPLIISRPSHGAHLHYLEKGHEKIVKLERFDWGARGLRSYGVIQDNKLLLTRRARKEVVFSEFKIDSSQMSEAKFYTVKIKPKKKSRPYYPKQLTSLPTPYQEQKVFFGDVHTHSAFSDGTGTIDEIYTRSWVRKHDFAILTDHDNIAGSRIFPSQYMDIAFITDWFNQLKNFSTIQAYEWTTPPLPRGSGHRNIYFKDQAINPVFNYQDQYKNTKTLFDALRGKNVFAVPHHTGWTGTDWENADEKIQRHVEITSVHGSFESADDNPFKTREKMPGMFIRDGLSKGHKFGFLAGSDAHGLPHHHGTARHYDVWSHGLTGVVSPTNSRQDLWQAMYQRKTFTTSGQRSFIFTSIDGHPMGSELHTHKVTVSYTIMARHQIQEVLVVKDGKRYTTLPIKGQNMQGSWTDTIPTKGEHSYYIRVVENGHHGPEMVWSGPIFVESKL